MHQLSEAVTRVGFERFDRVAAAAATKPPEISVLPNGVISMTWRAYELIGTPAYVEFYYDRAEGLVGIAPTSDKSNGYQVRLPRPKGDANEPTKGKVSVRGATFFKYYDIEADEKYSREPELVDGMLTFEVPRTSHPPAQISAPTVHEFLTREEPPF
jgi:hypothetical protein